MAREGRPPREDCSNSLHQLALNPLFSASARQKAGRACRRSRGCVGPQGSGKAGKRSRFEGGMDHSTSLVTTIVAALVLAFVLGTIAHRFRISPLVGYLLAGVVAGPFTPGYVADQG